LRLLLRQGLAPAWVGLAAGLAPSIATARTLPLLVPFSAAYDTRVALLVLVPLLLVVTLAAAFVPANRAATISPTVALRDE
jgi:ABC-type antimicrobial peptide transport system permease subunit